MNSRKGRGKASAVNVGGVVVNNTSIFSGDRAYVMSPWLEFMQDNSEKRFIVDYIVRQRLSVFGIVIFNVLHLVFSFLSIDLLQTQLFPVLDYLMILSLVLAIAVLASTKHYRDHNRIVQLLIRCSSMYFYCVCFMTVEAAQKLTAGSSMTNSWMAALILSTHMTFTNLLTLAHWKSHVVVNTTSFLATQAIVWISCEYRSNEAMDYLVRDSVCFVCVQVSMLFFIGSFERFIREFWVILDSFRKSTRQFEKIFDDLPQPMMIVGPSNEILLQNVAAQRYFVANPIEGAAAPIMQANLMSRFKEKDAEQIVELLKSVHAQASEKPSKASSIILQRMSKDPAAAQEGGSEAERAPNGSKAVPEQFIGSMINWKGRPCSILQICESELGESKEIKIEQVFEVVKEVEVVRKEVVIEPMIPRLDQTEATSIMLPAKKQLLASHKMGEFNYSPPQKEVIFESQPKSGSRQTPNAPTSVSTSASAATSVTHSMQKPPRPGFDSPNQSPINAVSPLDNISAMCKQHLRNAQDLVAAAVTEMDRELNGKGETEANLSTTQDHSDHEVNINIDDEISKNFNLIESGINTLVLQIIHNIQRHKGKKINISFGSTDTSPILRQNLSSINTGAQAHMPANMFKPGHQKADSFLGSNLEPKSPLEMNQDKNKVQPTKMKLMELACDSQSMNMRKAEENKKSQMGGNSNNYIFGASSRDEHLKDKDKSDEDCSSNGLVSILSPMRPSTHKIGPIQEEDESEIPAYGLVSGVGQDEELLVSEPEESEVSGGEEEEIESEKEDEHHVELKYVEGVCSIMLVEDSPNVNFVLPYMKLQQPKKFTCFKVADPAFEQYLKHVEDGFIYNIILIGIELKKGKGISGIELKEKIRNHERTNGLPRSYLVALFNSEGSEIGGKKKSRSTFLFQGFDNAIQRPVMPDNMNKIVNERINAPISYSTEEDYKPHYSKKERLMILTCHGMPTIVMDIQSVMEREDIKGKTHVGWSSKAILDKYFGKIEGGILYHFIIIPYDFMDERVLPVSLKGVQVVQQIRKFESENHIVPGTKVFAFCQNNEEMEKALNDGFDGALPKQFDPEKFANLMKSRVVEVNAERRAKLEEKEAAIRMKAEEKERKKQEKLEAKLEKKRQAQLAREQAREAAMRSNRIKQQKQEQALIEARKLREFEEAEAKLKQQKKLQEEQEQQQLQLLQSQQAKQQSQIKASQVVVADLEKKIDNSNKIIDAIPQTQSHEELEQAEESGSTGKFANSKPMGASFGRVIDEPSLSSSGVSATVSQQQQSGEKQISMKVSNGAGAAFGTEKKGLSQEEMDKLEMEQNSKTFMAAKAKGIVFGANGASVAITPAAVGAKVADNSENLLNSANTQSASVSVVAASAVAVEKPKKMTAEEMDRLELEQSSSIFKNAKDKGISFGKPAAKVSATAPLFLKEPKQLEKPAEIVTPTNPSATAATGAAAATSLLRKPMTAEEMDRMEEQQASGIFKNAKAKGISFGKSAGLPASLKGPIAEIPPFRGAKPKVVETTASNVIAPVAPATEAPKVSVPSPSEKQELPAATVPAIENRPVEQVKSLIVNKPVMTQEEMDRLEMQQAGSVFTNANAKGISFGKAAAAPVVPAKQGGISVQELIGKVPEMKPKQSSQQSNEDGAVVDNTASFLLKQQQQHSNGESKDQVKSKLIGRITPSQLLRSPQVTSNRYQRSPLQNMAGFSTLSSRAQNPSVQSLLNDPVANASQQQSAGLLKMSPLKSIPQILSASNSSESPQIEQTLVKSQVFNSLVASPNLKKDLQRVVKSPESSNVLIASGLKNISQIPVPKSQVQVQEKLGNLLEKRNSGVLNQSNSPSPSSLQESKQVPSPSSVNFDSQNSETVAGVPITSAAAGVTAHGNKADGNSDFNDNSSYSSVKSGSQNSAKASSRNGSFVQKEAKKKKSVLVNPGQSMNLDSVDKSSISSSVLSSMAISYNSVQTILVVDESSILSSLSLLKSDGKRVVEAATSVQSAFEMYQKKLKSKSTLYHFILLSVAPEFGGMDAMRLIRAYEKQHNLPKTYLVAIYNESTSVQKRAQVSQRDTLVVKGFDEAIERPLSEENLNALFKARESPQIVEVNEEQILVKCSLFDGFRILICEENLSMSADLRSMNFENGAQLEFASSGSEVIEKYRSAIEEGRIYSFIFVDINLKHNDGVPVIKTIRKYETETLTQRTYIIGFMPIGQQSPVLLEKKTKVGFNMIIDNQHSQESIEAIIAKVELSLQSSV